MKTRWFIDCVMYLWMCQIIVSAWAPGQLSGIHCDTYTKGVFLHLQLQQILLYPLVSLWQDSQSKNYCKCVQHWCYFWTSLIKPMILDWIANEFSQFNIDAANLYPARPFGPAWVSLVTAHKHHVMWQDELCLLPLFKSHHAVGMKRSC